MENNNYIPYYKQDFKKGQVNQERQFTQTNIKSLPNQLQSNSGLSTIKNQKFESNMASLNQQVQSFQKNLLEQEDIPQQYLPFQTNLDKEKSYREQNQNIIIDQKLKEQQQLNQLNEIQDKNSQLSKQCEELKKQIEELTKQNSNLQFEKNDIKQQYSDLNLRFNGKINQEKIYFEEHQKYQEAINKLETEKNEKEILNQKIMILEEELNQKTKFVGYKDESEYGYDMIIQMSSLYDLQNNKKQQENEIENERENEIDTDDGKPQKGKDISGLTIQTFKKDFNPDLQDVIVVGLQGQRNKGKTFILNSLINENFPSDFHLSTPGVCIKQHQINSKNLVYVDSEGLGNPISMDYENNQSYQAFIDDKRRTKKIDDISFNNLSKDITDKHFDIKATEQIQQEFIIQNSNILIIAISQVTLEDQKLIHSISEKFIFDHEQTFERKLIIVHNLKDFHRPEYMKDYMIQLKKNFSVKEQVINNYKEQENEVHCNTILFDEVRPHITHVLMGYKDSEAGRQYNKFALHYIKSVITMCKDLQKFDIRETLKNYLNQNIHHFIEIKNEQTDEVKQIKDKEKLEYCEKNQKIILKKGYVLDKLKELQINIFGSLYKDCYYSIVKSKQKPDSELFLFVEIPGTSKIMRKYEKSDGKFILRITQNDEIEKSVGEDIKQTTRKFEEKEMPIQICKEKELWSYIRERDTDLKNGVYKFVFIKDDENKDFS